MNSVLWPIYIQVLLNNNHIDSSVNHVLFVYVYFKAKNNCKMFNAE